MKKIKYFIARVFNRFFPVTRNVVFRTEDNLVRCILAVNENAVLFWWLKTPTPFEQFEKGALIKDAKTEHTQPDVILHFYSPESVDKFMETLKKVKENIILQQANRIIENGGTWTWEATGDQKEIFPGATMQTYTATIQYPPDTTP